MPSSRSPLQLVLGLAILALALAACGEDGDARTEPATTPQAESAPSREAQSQADAEAGTIVGRATDERSGEPLSDVHIVVGYKGVQRAAITGPDGRYVVRDVPAGEPAAILGFHDGNYRYHNSRYDADVVPTLEPGETFDYDFTVLELDDPAGQPQVSDPAISTTTARPGDTVQFALTVTGGEGGLSDEVFASSPELGRVAWLSSADGDRYRGELTIPPGTESGEYPFAFFAASNKCYDPERFPRLVLRVVADGAGEEASAQECEPVTVPGHEGVDLRATGVACPLARFVAAAAEGRGRRPYDAGGFACEPSAAPAGDTNYTCSRADGASVRFRWGTA